MKDKAAVLLSGGLDSATCLGLAVNVYGADNVCAMTMSYGQRHSKETDCAKALAGHYGVELYTIDLSGIFDGADCSLLESSDKSVPDGTYDEQIHDKGVSTYVPFRNGLMLSALAAKAVSLDSKASWHIVIGVHSDDAVGEAYPDCSQRFIDAISNAVEVGTYGAATVEAPFVSLCKSDVVSNGLRLGVPYELTWSCYKGGEKQCGTCATCLDRKKAFEVNGAIDPVSYEV